jgi:hypothetical protein
MFITLINGLAGRLAYQTELIDAYRYQNGAPKQTIPWVFGIIVIAVIEKNRPLVARNHHFTTTELSLHPNIC